MKCPKCKTNMDRKVVPNKAISYFECPKCHNTIGKPTEVENETKETGSKEE